MGGTALDGFKGFSQVGLIPNCSTIGMFGTDKSYIGKLIQVGRGNLTLGLKLPRVELYLWVHCIETFIGGLTGRLQHPCQHYFMGESGSSGRLARYFTSVQSQLPCYFTLLQVHRFQIPPLLLTFTQNLCQVVKTAFFVCLMFLVGFEIRLFIDVINMHQFSNKENQSVLILYL